MKSKFEEMGHRFGDKFVVVKDYYSLKVGDIVTAISSSSANTIECIKEGGLEVWVLYFSKGSGGFIEVIPYKEESTVVSKTNTLNVGEVGSSRYEVIRKVLAVLDGDKVRIDDEHDYSGYSGVKEAAEYLKKSIIHQDEYPLDYQLKSEQLPVLSEKDLKIKELEDNIEVMKKNLEELKGM